MRTMVSEVPNSNNDEEEQEEDTGGPGAKMGKHTPGFELWAMFPDLWPVYQPLWVTNYKMELNTGLPQGFTVRSEITRKVLGTVPGSQQAPHNS